MTISLGELGEQLVATWLQDQEYQMLHHRWRCRWGEIDLIARHQAEPILIFVEVKTRGNRSWDSRGLDAISPGKQQKISQTSALFLAKNPQFTDFYCRFDVALVRYRPTNSALSSYSPDNHQFLMRKNYPPGYSLMLEDYLTNAFDFSD